MIGRKRGSIEDSEGVPQRSVHPGVPFGDPQAIRFPSSAVSSVRRSFRKENRLQSNPRDIPIKWQLISWRTTSTSDVGVGTYKQRDTAKLHGEKNEEWSVEQTIVASLESTPRCQREGIVCNSTHRTCISSNLRTNGWRSTVPQTQLALR